MRRRRSGGGGARGDTPGLRYAPGAGDGVATAGAASGDGGTGGWRERDALMTGIVMRRVHSALASTCHVYRCVTTAQRRHDLSGRTHLFRTAQAAQQLDAELVVRHVCAVAAARSDQKIC